jgi:hypothetical protein
MVYPVKMQVRYSTVLVIVLLLMGSVFYEVTRTESFGRQNAARTQDIALPAPQPVVHTISGATRMDYIGGSSIGHSSVQPFQPSDELIATVGYTSTGAAATAAASNSQGQGWGANLGQGRALARAHSSGSTGYAPGSYGMGGVGAWGGVSGVMRPVAAPAAALVAGPKKERPAKAPSPKKPGNNGKGNGSSGSSNSGGGGATEVASGSGAAGAGAVLTGGFTTGAAAVESGAVASVQAGGSSPQGPAPASTPEPMSLMLVGTGIAALVGVRRHIK